MPLKILNGVDLNAQRAQNAGDPSSAQDLATKNYVDNVARGLDWKQSVRAASTGNVSVSSAPSSIDGVTLAANDRVLLKDQTTGSENGIYTFAAAASALTRALDADSSAEVTSGLAVTITEGTANGDKVYALSTNDPITLGTTALVFAQVGGGGSSYTAGNGLTLTSTTFDVGAGTGISVAADAVAVDTAVVARHVAFNVGDGSSTSISLAHNLGTYDVSVTVFLNSGTRDDVLVDVQRGVDVNHVELIFATAPASSAYRAVVIG
jgi:phage-related tail fiber protein